MKGEQAFPTPETANYERVRGLTKRELLAAMALQGLLARSDARGSFSEYAGLAVSAADALIEELSK